jgi:DNA-binding transcriptional regulator LsrR (DeoR family)
MPQQRMDIRMIKDILRLKYQGGLSHERIAQSLGVSKGGRGQVPESGRGRRS